MLLRWVWSALTRNWKLVAGAFGVLAIYGKGRLDKKNLDERKKLEEDLKRSERLRNVEISTTRDDALERLSSTGHVRKD